MRTELTKIRGYISISKFCPRRDRVPTVDFINAYEVRRNIQGTNHFYEFVTTECIVIDMLTPLPPSHMKVFVIFVLD